MIKHIKLFNFRRYKKFEIDTNSNFIIFKGKNAIGKTSILEAIYLTSTFKSHRTNNNLDLIKENEKYSKIQIDADNKYEIILSETGKKGIIDNVEMKKASEFIGNLRCVLFSPEDQEIINGSKKEKRGFLDLEISLLNKRYLSTLKECRYFLSERNQILKKYKPKDENYLNIVTQELSKREKMIALSRMKFINLINQKLNEVHQQIKKDEFLRIEYQSTLPDILDESSYHSNVDQDILYKMTLRGVQRDSYTVYLNEHDVSSYASEGQLKNIAISLKIALVKVIQEYSKEEVILLLDDVFSLLDKDRIDNLYNFLSTASQTFISCVDTIDLDNKIKGQALIIDLDKKENLYGEY